MWDIGPIGSETASFHAIDLVERSYSRYIHKLGYLALELGSVVLPVLVIIRRSIDIKNVGIDETYSYAPPFRPTHQETLHPLEWVFG